MRTTVDLDPTALERAKRLAQQENRTLGSVLSDALTAYLSRPPKRSPDAPFELLVRGRTGAPFPSVERMAQVEQDEELEVLSLPSKRHATP